MAATGNEIIDEDVIALAGIYQAVNLVKQTARSGGSDGNAFRASIGSVFRFDADSAESVFGGLGALCHGLETLADQLGGRDRSPDPELTAYAANLMFLERKLSALPWMTETLRAEIDVAKRMAESDSVDAPAIIANLAHAYSQTISRLSPRILVQGEPELLEDAEVANRIRALLLAGMRAAVLWRQVGGSRLKLLFARKRIVREARAALAMLEG